MYNLLSENVQFMRIFQVFGCLPLKLTKNESKLFRISSLFLAALAAISEGFNIFLNYDKAPTVIVVSLNVVLLICASFFNWIDKEMQITFLKVLGDIDRRIANNLKMQKELKERNVRLNRTLTALWIVYLVMASYNPMSILLASGIRDAYRFFSRLLVWSLIIHVIKTKYLYFYAIILVRLDVIKKWLEDMQVDKHALLLIREIYQKKFAKNFERYSKIRALKEIYHRVWLLQGLSYQLSGKFIVVYIVSYLGLLICFFYSQIKPAILSGTFFDRLTYISLFFLALNTFSVAFFVVSYKINLKGMQIAGLIHNLLETDDHENHGALKMLSHQVIQQPMTTINVLGIFNYDRANLSGMIFLYSTLIYEVTKVNFALVDLKKQAQALGVPAIEETLIVI